MKAKCPREGLLTACQLASVALPAATKQPLRPILANLKAVADDNGLTIMATDLEIGIRYGLRGPEIDEAGEAILPAARLVNALREATDGDLVLEADDSTCRIHGLSCKFEMPTESPADFPDVPDFDEAAYHEMQAGVLRDMIRRVLFAAAKDEQARFAATNGVLWELSDTSIRLVATDSKRLAVCSGDAMSVGGHGNKGQSSVVPPKAMTLLERTLAVPDGDEPVRICLRGNDVLFQMAGTVISSRLKEGKYPAWGEIIPKKIATTVPLPVEHFFSAVRQAAVMTEADNRRVLFAFEPGNLTLSAKTQSAARSEVKLPVGYDGPGLKISFDPTYLVEMLKSADPETDIQLDLVNPERPALFRQGERYLYLVCPMT